MDNIITADRLIALVASVAGLVSAVATLLTVLEMRRQRESSYKPTFLFRTTYLGHIIKNKAESYIIATEAVDTDLDIDLFENRPKTKQLGEYVPIHFHNIGLGSAKNVQFRWTYDLTGFESIFEKVSAYKITTSDKKSFGIETKDGASHQWVLRKHSASASLEFVLPIYNKQETSFIFIPTTYRELLEKLLNGISKSNNKMETFNFPRLFLEVSYFDIENNKFKENYSVSFQIRHQLITQSKNFYLYAFLVKKTS